MQSEEIRRRFLEFFKKRGHAVLPSASLIPENDPSVLFTTAGMQPLVPYLMGEKHPLGNRLVNVQKCVRTQDIEEVGDKTHDTFFEMLGNWSLGDPDAPDGVGTGYFKKEAITWSYEFLTSKKEGLGLDPRRLYITCFLGDSDAPKDEESAEIWKSLGIPENRIYFLGKDKNWWSPGPTGPCGPDTEMYYDITPKGLGDLDLEGFKKADDSQQIIEIWNDVFMEYNRQLKPEKFEEHKRLLAEGKSIPDDFYFFSNLSQKNVDTGAGLERLAMVMQGKNNIFDTDLFAELMEKSRALSEDIRIQRIISDHIRTAIFMIGDGVLPSNTDRGYILRRLIRRAVFYAKERSLDVSQITSLVRAVVIKYESVYENLKGKEERITTVIQEEQEKFLKTIKQGIGEFEKISDLSISGERAFLLFSTYGFPIELTRELATKNGKTIDEKGFHQELAKHQELSRKGAEQKFAGGLADHSEQTIKYHTATHMLHEALRRVLGSHVHQRGSNITQERLRFDFAHPQKMTEEEKKKAEDLMNEKIQEDLPVSFEEMSPDEAFSKGALGEFGAKYGDRVKVYSVGEGTNRFSYEICGGPHVERTGTMGTFKIIKEEAVAQGIRRIKAVLQ